MVPCFPLQACLFAVGIIQACLPAGTPHALPRRLKPAAQAKKKGAGGFNRCGGGVEQTNLKAGLRENLRNTPPHRPGADDGDSFDWLTTQPIFSIYSGKAVAPNNHYLRTQTATARHHVYNNPRAITKR